MMSVPLERAKANLDEVLAQLQPGETITLVDAQGQPVVAMTSLQPQPKLEPLSLEEWWAGWQSLIQEVDETWEGEKSAVDVLLEMRR